MESNLVSVTVAGGKEVLARGAVRVGLPSGSPPVEPPVVPKSSGEPELLSRAPSGETTGSLRRTFARFTVDHETKEVSVEIVDASSNEVIRSIPGDELQRMARQYGGQGFVFDSAV